MNQIQNEKVARLQIAAQELAKRCDGAFEDDGRGFNGADADFGHDLANREFWSIRQAQVAAKMLQKYKSQLSGYGVDISDISESDFEPETSANPPATGTPSLNTIDFVNGVFHVYFEYHAPLVAKVKSYKGATYAAKYYNDSSKKFWVFRIENSLSVQQLEKENLFILTDAAKSALKNPMAISAMTAPTLPSNRIELCNNKLVLMFDYEASQVEFVKTIPGREFNKIPKHYPKAWTVQPTPANIEKIVEYLHDFKPQISEEIRELVSRVASDAKISVEQSKAHDGEIELDYGVDLFPFQRAGVGYSLAKKKTFIADEMGLGKTHQSIATVHAANAYPCLVVCPASVKINWMREIYKGTEREKSVSIWNGKEGSDKTDFVVINYDVIAKHKNALLSIPFKSIIFDESHYLKNYKAKRSETAKEIAKGKEFILCLTGTPVMNRPQELLSQLGIMQRLDDLGGFWHFAKRYCAAYKGRWGWDFSGAANLDELNEKLRATCFVRRRKAEVFSEMPKLTRAEVTVSISNPAEYAAAEQDAISFIRAEATKNAEFLASIKHLSEIQQKEAKQERADSAEYKASRAEALVKINLLKMLAAKGKLEAIKDWTESFLETGEKLVIFAEHIQVQKSLLEAIPNAARIFGEDTSEERQRNIDRFQADKNCQVIICSLAAGGTGIDGLQNVASNIAFCEQGWTPAIMNQAAARLDRFGQKFPVTAWYLLAENTIDLTIKALLDKKQAVCDAATDGGTETAGKSIFGELVREMLRR